jgi:hypothetical protein
MAVYHDALTNEYFYIPQHRPVCCDDPKCRGGMFKIFRKHIELARETFHNGELLACQPKKEE